jgi:hypothetical protein
MIYDDGGGAVYCHKMSPGFSAATFRL